MKLKILLLLTIVMLYNHTTIKATTFEIWISNRTGNTDILIKFYPVGSLFNGGDIHYSSTIDYSLRKTTDGYFNQTTRRNSGEEPIFTASVGVPKSLQKR